MGKFILTLIAITISFYLGLVSGYNEMNAVNEPYTIVYEADCYIGDSKDESRLIRLTVDDAQKLIDKQ